MLHPRRCGLACYIGVTANKPTIGVAKSLLCGSLQSDGFVIYNEEIIGYAIKRDINPRKTIYVSVGHRISLPTAVELVGLLTKTGEWIPEPLRVADIASKDHGNGE